VPGAKPKPRPLLTRLEVVLEAEFDDTQATLVARVAEAPGIGNRQPCKRLRWRRVVVARGIPDRQVQIVQIDIAELRDRVIQEVESR